MSNIESSYVFICLSRGVEVINQVIRGKMSRRVPHRFIRQMFPVQGMNTFTYNILLALQLMLGLAFQVLFGRVLELLRPRTLIFLVWRFSLFARS